MPKPWTTVFPTPTHWDERFAGPGYFYGTEPNEFLRSLADRIPVGDTLCLAEGEGRNAVFLAGRGAQVTAVDASAAGLAKTRALAAERGVAVETIHADLSSWRIGPGTWDVVVAIFCHLPPEIRGDVHRRAVAGLRSGGVFVLEAYTPEQLRYGTGGPEVEELLMRLADLRGELAGLEFEIAREVEREVHEGQGHTGRSAVVQVFGRKVRAD